MTEYGRGQEGSEPWHPQDPYYGDGGWEGQQGHDGHQAAYGGQPQHYPQAPQQPEHGDWGNGRQADYGQAQQQYQQQYPQQYGQQQYDPQQSYDQQQYAAQQHQQYDNQYGNNGWGTGTHTHVQYPDPSDPYGQQAAAYGTGDQPDYYGTPDAYPPPEPPSRRRAEPEPQRADWDPGPDQGEHAFFAGGGDDDDEPDADADDPGGQGDRRGRGGKKPKKRRSGCACLVVVLVFGGGIAGVGYFGYQFYQDRFSSAPDFAGDGTSATVSVVVPKGANGADMGRLLKEAGVVKSVDAFVSAFTQNDNSGRIQAGAYVMNKEMSAKSAVELMLDPKSQNAVVVAPGQRNIAVYKKIDDKLGLKSGATKKAAEAKYKSLGLPDWAEKNSEMKDPLEGFLYPGTYPAADGMKPETVLKEMVSAATKKYAAFDLEAKAKALKLDSPMDIVTIASLVQAEGKTTSDYRRMAEVVYNRLDYGNPQTYGFLQFDSTFNYAKNESNIDISESEINKDKDPYNTYTNKGLPPGPIGNPGDDAIKSTLNPTDEGWYYFVATDGVSKTEFAKTHEAFQKLKDKFDASRGN